MSNEIAAIALIIGLIIVGVVITKAIWQWVIGTDQLQKEAKEQTILLENILKELRKKKEE